MAVERYNLTFSKQMANQPIIYNLGKKYNLVTVIERANVSEEAGWIQIAFNGDVDEISRAVADLNGTGVFITPLELAFLG
jgi:hypothetical protein